MEVVLKSLYQNVSNKWVTFESIDFFYVQCTHHYILVFKHSIKFLWYYQRVLNNKMFPRVSILVGQLLVSIT